MTAPASGLQIDWQEVPAPPPDITVTGIEEMPGYDPDRFDIMFPMPSGVQQYSAPNANGISFPPSGVQEYVDNYRAAVSVTQVYSMDSTAGIRPWPRSRVREPVSGLSNPCNEISLETPVVTTDPDDIYKLDIEDEQ